MENYELISTVCGLVGISAGVTAMYMDRKHLFEAFKNGIFFKDGVKPLYENIVKPVLNKIRHKNKKTIDNFLDRE